MSIRSFSDEGVQSRAFGFERLAPKSLDVEANRALHIAQSLFEGVSLPHNDTLNPRRIGYIAFEVFLDNDLHVPKLPCPSARFKSSILQP